MQSCTFSIPYYTFFSDSPLVHFGPHHGGTPTIAAQEHKLALLDERGRGIVRRLYALGGTTLGIFIGRTSVEVVRNNIPPEMRREVLHILKEATGTEDIRMACSP